MNLTLNAKPPFSFYHTVRSHGWYQLAPCRFDEQAVTLSYVDQLSNGRVIELVMQEASAGVSVDIDAQLEALEIEEVRQKVSWMFGLEQEFSAFYELAQQEPKLQKAIELGRGRVLRSPSLFEDVIKTILTTNTIWGSTRNMTQRLVEQYGASLPDNPPRKAFPTPQHLADEDPQALREKVRSGYRSPYIIELARQVASGSLDLEGLKSESLPTQELRKRLLALKGVGAYAAANLLMILGRYDSIPVDSWALKVVSHEWFHGEPVGPEQVEAAFSKWGQWKGLAYWFWDWSIHNEG
jgi:3-methyladenine DNA glycosylase/8-oxoguanine DNA glycosylase